MNLFQILTEVLQHIRLVVLLKDDEEDYHVDGKEKEDDQHKFEYDLRS